MAKQGKKPQNPPLFQRAKKKARATSEGSPPGRWSSRKAALAGLWYEKQGGKWEKTTPPPVNPNKPKGGSQPDS